LSYVGNAALVQEHPANLNIVADRSLFIVRASIEVHPQKNWHFGGHRTGCNKPKSLGMPKPSQAEAANLSSSAQ
jgi:hypothetical protein